MSLRRRLPALFLVFVLCPSAGYALGSMTGHMLFPAPPLPAPAPVDFELRQRNEELGKMCIYLLNTINNDSSEFLALADQPAKAEQIPAPKENKEDPAPKDGYYFCEGRLCGIEYDAIVLIQKKTADIWAVQWTSGDTLFKGVGHFDGKSHFTVAWRGPGDSVGLVRYQRCVDENDKVTWVGKQYVSPSDGEAGMEKLEFLRAMKKEK